MRDAAPALLPRLLWLLSLIGAGGGAARAFTPGADGPVSSVETLEGARAELACDTSLPPVSAAPAADPAPPIGRDSLMLLVWYKDNSPVYSYDARVPSEWASDAFNRSGRVRSVAPAPGQRDSASRLVISGAAADDQALYHCRVDFQLSPTRNSAVNLTVIVLPSQPFFLDEVGNKVEGRVGPYHEEDNLVLSCLVIGGRPAPQVRWYSGDTLLDATDFTSEIPGVRENELFLPLAREHAASPLLCRARNTNLAPERVSTLQLELYVTAESIETGWESGAEEGGALVAGRRAVAHCRARGAYPQPALSWWLDSRELTGRFNQSWNAETRTADSYAEVRPTRAQHGATLSCVATNVLLAPARATTTHTTQLIVLYSPAVEVVKLSPGRLNETSEGAPLHLRCDVEANPPVTSLSWYFNDSEISSPQLSTLFEAAKAEGIELVVAPAWRPHGGRYSCDATNERGNARSEDISIAVMYAPECRSAGVTLTGESVQCEVDALPAPDTYLWRVRGAGDLQMITTATRTLRLSLLQGSLDAPLQVWCEAANAAGSQRAPCEATFSLRHLRPAPPAHCDMTFELNAFHVHCEPGGNATYHVLSVWRMSASNSSLALAWRARSAYSGGGGTDAGGAVGTLASGDEAGVAACNNYGCSTDTLLRPSAALLQAAAPPWWKGAFLSSSWLMYLRISRGVTSFKGSSIWKGLFEKDFGISLGIIVIIVVFIVSSLLITKAIGRFSRTRTKPPVIQVLQLDDFSARDYLDTLERKARSHKSCSSVYSGGSLDTDSCPPLVDRSRKPLAWPCEVNSRECLPDITAQLTRESAV